MSMTAVVRLPSGVTVIAADRRHGFVEATTGKRHQFDAGGKLLRVGRMWVTCTASRSDNIIPALERLTALERADSASIIELLASSPRPVHDVGGVRYLLTDGAEVVCIHNGEVTRHRATYTFTHPGGHPGGDWPVATRMSAMVQQTIPLMARGALPNTEWCLVRFVARMFALTAEGCPGVSPVIDLGLGGGSYLSGYASDIARASDSELQAALCEPPASSAPAAALATFYRVRDEPLDRLEVAYGAAPWFERVGSVNTNGQATTGSLADVAVTRPKIGGGAVGAEELQVETLEEVAVQTPELSVGPAVASGKRLEASDTGSLTMFNADESQRTVVGDYSVTQGTLTSQSETDWSPNTDSVESLTEGVWVASSGGAINTLTAANLPSYNGEVTVKGTVTAEVVDPGSAVLMTTEARIRAYVDLGSGYVDKGIIAYVSHSGLSGSTSQNFTAILEGVTGTTVTIKLVSEVRWSAGGGGNSRGECSLAVSTAPWNTVTWKKSSGTNLARRGVRVGASSDDPHLHLEPMSSALVPEDADLVEGDVWMDGVAHVPRFFDGGTRFPLGGDLVAVKASDQATTSTTYQSITDLNFPLEPNRKYRFRFNIAWSSAVAANGIGLTINGPSSPTRFIAFVNHHGDAGDGGTIRHAQGSYIIRTYNTGLNSSEVDVAGQEYAAYIEGIIETGASGGTLQARFRSRTGGSITVYASSFGVLAPAVVG